MSAKDDRRQHGELSLAARILPNGPKPRPWHSSSFAMEGWWTFMTLASAQLKTRDDQGKRRRNREGLLSHSLRAVWESIQPSLRFLGDAADLDIPDCQSWPTSHQAAHLSRLDNVNHCLRCFGVDGGSTVCGGPGATAITAL